MNETVHPSLLGEVPRPRSDDPLRVADTSMLPGGEKPPLPVVDLLTNATQSAHNTIDRLADRAAPAVQQLGEGVAAAQDALQSKVLQLRGTGDVWLEGTRCTVRGNPLVSVATAFALGAVFARIVR